MATNDAVDYTHEPITCTDCGELVVVTRPENPQTADEQVRFECGCSVGLIGAVKPDSWTGGSFL
jgi:hypothetical protein